VEKAANLGVGVACSVIFLSVLAPAYLWGWGKYTKEKLVGRIQKK